MYTAATFHPEMPKEASGAPGFSPKYPPSQSARTLASDSAMRLNKKYGLGESILRYIGVAGEADGFPRRKPKEKEITVPSDIPNSGDQAAHDQQTHTATGAPATPGAASVGPIQPAPAPAPVKSGPSALKIILIVILVFVGLGILGAGAVVWRVARAVHVSGPNGQFTMNTPNGTITANSNETFTASDLGTDIYPGATEGKGSMRMTLPTGSMVSAVFVTPDSKDQVVSYYKDKLGSDASTFDNATSAIITANKGKDESVMVTVTANQSQYGGKTQITIVHSTNNKPS